MFKIIKEIRQELTKVKFPQKKEVVQSFVMMLVFLIISGIILALFDYLMSFVSLLF